MWTWRIDFDVNDSYYDEEKREVVLLPNEFFEYAASHEVIHAVLHEIAGLEACRKLDLVRYGFEFARGDGEAIDDKLKLCDQVNGCEHVSGVDCLVCDVYWKWYFDWKKRKIMKRHKLPTEDVLRYLMKPRTVAKVAIHFGVKCGLAYAKLRLLMKQEYVKRVRRDRTFYYVTTPKGRQTLRT